MKTLILNRLKAFFTINILKIITLTGVVFFEGTFILLFFKDGERDTLLVRGFLLESVDYNSYSKVVILYLFFLSIYFNN